MLLVFSGYHFWGSKSKSQCSKFWIKNSLWVVKLRILSVVKSDQRNSFRFWKSLSRRIHWCTFQHKRMRCQWERQELLICSTFKKARRVPLAETRLTVYRRPPVGVLPRLVLEIPLVESHESSSIQSWDFGLSITNGPSTWLYPHMIHLLASEFVRRTVLMFSVKKECSIEKRED